MKRKRKYFDEILDRSLAWHRNPSSDEIESVVNRVWDSLPAQESVEFRIAIEGPPPRAKFRAWRLAAVAAVVFVVSVTLIQTFHPDDRGPASLPPLDVPALANGDALLVEAVSTHLSRTVPAPMEPIMTLVPAHYEMAQPGGKQ